MRIEVADGASLTPEDVSLIDALFGNNRIIIRHDKEVAEVYLYLWTTMNVKKGQTRTLKGVGYGKLIDTHSFEDSRALAEEVGKQILGCKVELSMDRMNGCEGFIVASCRLIDFMRNL